LGSWLALVWFLVIENVSFLNASAGDLVPWFLVLFSLAMEIVHMFQKIKIKIEPAP